MQFRYLMGMFAVGVLMAGCTKDPDPVVVKEGSGPVASSKASELGMSEEEMSKAHSEDEGASSEDLKKLQKAMDDAKAAYEKNTKNEKAKKAYVDATVELGTATMMSPDLPPREKYRAALKLYRDALKLDPKNSDALANKKTIEDIYVSMGRPIPE